MYTKEELKSFISQGFIKLEDGTIHIDDEKLSKKAFVRSMKELYSKEDFSDYRKESNGQKKKSKIRKK